MLIDTKAPKTRISRPDTYLSFTRAVGGLNSSCPGDVGAGKDLIDHQGKSVWITVCGSKDHIERLAKGNWFILKWR